MDGTVNRGTVVVNETLFAITDVRLRAGVIEVLATAALPSAAFEGGVTDVRMYGEDGSSVGELRMPFPAYPAAPSWTVEQMHVVIPFHLTELTPPDGMGRTVINERR